METDSVSCFGSPREGEMNAKNRISLVRKTLYGIMLIAVSFAAFGGGNFSSAYAQAGAMNIITATTPDIVNYTDSKYKFELKIPSNWYISPASFNGIGTVTTISSFDRILLDPQKSVIESIAGIKIDIGLITYDRPQDIALTDWVAPDPDNIDSFLSQSSIVVNGINAIKQIYRPKFGKSQYIVFIPSSQKVYFFAVIPFGEINSDAAEFRVAETILQSFSPGTRKFDPQSTKSTLYQAEIDATPPNIITNAPSGYRLPFAGQKDITNGPGCSSTHLGNSSEAIDFGLSTGSRVLATQTGDIVYAVYGWNDGFGNLLKLHHNDGNTSWYAHLDSFVKTSGSFSMGEFVALSDNTGNSTGAHLHFEVRNSSNQSIWIRDLPGITWYSGDSNNPCQPAGYNDGIADGPPEGGGGGACSAPSLNSPGDGYVSSSQTVSFSWSAVSGCTFNGYTFRIKDTSNMDSGDNTIVDTGEGGTSRTETIGTQWNNRDLWWGVKAANAPNGASWSVRRFRIEPGGGGCNPNADQVAFYVDPNYGGSCSVKGIGNYPNPGSMGVGNDSLSSIKVGSNVKLTLCRDDNYSGTCETFTGDDSNLGDNNIGENQASSAKVEPRNGGTWAYQIFDLGDYNGDKYESNQTINDFASVGWNDRAESIKINSGYEIIACEHANFQGNCGRVTGPNQFSDINALAQGLRNGLSSIKVCSGSCPSAPDAPSLSSPGNGSAHPSNYDLTFQWNTSSNANDYLVEWWGGPYSTMQPCGWTSSTSCHIGVVAAGHTYYWHVKARNSVGESGWSSTWSFTIQAQLPSANFDAWPQSGYAPLTVAMHIVDVANITSCQWNYGDGQTSTTCTQLHDHVYNGLGSYTVSLTVNGPGGSDSMTRTDYITVTSLIPPTPNNFHVSATTEDSITLAWDDVSGETGYKIYKWGYDGAQWTFIYLATTNANVTNFTDANLSCGSDFNYYELSAYNSNGESEHHSWIQGTTNECPPAELAITGINLSPDIINANENILVGVDIQNSSTVNVSEFWIDIYTNHIPTGCGDLGNYYVTAEGLAANSTNTWWVKIPAGELPAGSYEIRAFVDSGCEISEANENNNLAGPSVLSVLTPPPAPSHDDFDAARLISPMPYTEVVDVSGAWKAPDDPPVPVCNLAPGLASVWYKYIPSRNTRLSLDTFGSDFDTYLAVWTGSRGNLTLAGCNDDTDGTYRSELKINLTAGTIYFIEVAEFNGLYPSAMIGNPRQTRPKPDEWTPSGFVEKEVKNAAPKTPSNFEELLAGGSLTFHVTDLTQTETFISAGTADGWLIESGEFTNKGGLLNKTDTTLRLGDDAAKKQYRSILSFSTKGLPDNAVITKVALKVKKQAIIGGGNPVTMFQGFMLDVKKGIFGASALQATDFQTTANKSYGPFKPVPVNNWYTFNLTSAKSYINKLATSGGLTQIRLRFKLDDNNNAIANYLALFSGNATAAYRPQLIIEYYVP